MKTLKYTLCLTALICIALPFKVSAVNKISNDGIIERSTPLNEESTSGWKWTWLSDDACVNFLATDGTLKETLGMKYSLGMLSQWAENGTNDTCIVIRRDAYSGKWSQDVNGVKSFTFDDCTIPVGPTNIDGVIYAFNGYGELMNGYNYWGDLKTGADGLVATDNPEFMTWLATQYLPECTSHE